MTNALSQEQLEEARQKLAAGRVVAYRTMPYYTNLLMSINTFERPGLETMAVDKHWRLYYDPQVCLDWTVQEIGAVWLHEIQHILRKHNERFEWLPVHQQNHRMFNFAADAGINTDLRKQKIVLPDPENRVYIESQLSSAWKEGMTVEQLYWLINPQDGDDEQGNGDSGNGSSGNQSQDQQDSDQNSSQDSQGSSQDSNQGSEEGSKDSGSSSESSDPSESGNASESPQKPSDGSESNEGATDQSQGDNASAGDSEAGESTSEQGEGSNDSGSEGQSGDEGSPDGSSSPSASDSQGSSSSSAPSGGSGGQSNSQDSQSSTGSPNGEVEIGTVGDIRANQQSGQQQDQQQPNPYPSPKSSNQSTGSEQGGASNTERTRESGQNSIDHDAIDHMDDHDCGSVSGGDAREYEEPTDSGSIDNDAADSILKRTAEDIINYDNSHPGSIPGDVVREAKKILEPQVDWRTEFSEIMVQTFTTQNGYGDYSYVRPSNRTFGTDIILPALVEPDPPNIAVVIDTSGSMNENTDIAAALGETEELLERFGKTGTPGIHVISCDANATDTLVKDLNSYEMVGGGGTDMRIGIDLASKLKPQMDAIIVITDGGTPWPDEIPEDNLSAVYIVVLVVSGMYARRSKESTLRRIPEWFKTVTVDIPDSR